MAQQTIVIEVPGTPISELEPTSSVSPNDVLPVVQGDQTKKAPLEQVADLVKSGLGTAALKNESDFATPAAVAEASQASQMRDDAQNERIDNVEHGLVSIGSGADASFSTYAEMIAYVPPKANVSVRNNDPDPALRGVYIWTGTQYVSGYDPLDEAKRFALEVSEEKAKEEVSKVSEQTTSQENAVEVKDKYGNMLFRIDVSSLVYVEGFKESLQSILKDLLSKGTFIFLDENGGNVLNVKDVNNNLALCLDKNNELFLSGLDQSVQSLLKNIGKNNKEYSCPLTTSSTADLYSIEALTSLNYLKINDFEVCPIPRGLVPQQYHIGKDWVNNIFAPISTNALKIAAYNDRGTKTNLVQDSGVVHPNLILFDKPLAGFKYWLAINPYTNTNEDYELLYIYGSNSENLDNWELIESFPQPFDTDPLTNKDDELIESTSGHLSDSFFTYDTSNGTLYFCWRKLLYFKDGRDRSLAKCSLLASKTNDGINWSGKFEIYPEFTNINKNILASPAMIFNPIDGLFYLYHIDDSVNGRITLQKTANLENPNWSDPIYPSGFDAITPYHMEIKWVGDAFVMLIHEEVNDQIHFAISYDGFNFQLGKSVLVGETSLYKSSFIPIFENSKMSMKILYTTDQRFTPTWRLHSTQTNFVEIGDQ
ncbi:hypothetical protein IX87_21410 [Acinetobacter baumannii]|uniref:hypothetical protein n=1 Tax=Acinetobacter baumannii TaxID=470 RepID=UPI0004F63E06|nr:hypothetical protein [Acinetobacter baumannii]AIL81077.1 hypothetical protein IX87_21410 [Acinetobacter baumannii]